MNGTKIEELHTLVDDENHLGPDRGWRGGGVETHHEAGLFIANDRSLNPRTTIHRERDAGTTAPDHVGGLVERDPVGHSRHHLLLVHDRTTIGASQSATFTSTRSRRSPAATRDIGRVLSGPVAGHEARDGASSVHAHDT